MIRYYKQRNRHWISFLILFVVISLSGCSSIISSKMPSGSVSMTKAYQQAIDGNDEDVDKDNSIQQLRYQVKPLNHSVANQSNNNEFQELNAEFPRLPNPGIIMYVYPHFVGSGAEQVPVPGYFTAFELYDHNYYLPHN